MVWFLFFRNRGSGSAAPAPSSSPTVTASPTASPTTSPSQSPKPTSTAVKACADSAIGVAVATDKKTYPVGSPVKLTLTISNKGDVACIRDVGAKANTLLITSGGEAVWSSDDCNPGGNANEVTMKPGDVYEVKLTWEGAVTQGSCPATPAQAAAGAYDTEGRNGDVTSSQVRFSLT
jgi:hypothetical protein